MEMESRIFIPVTLEGSNYLVWSRVARVTLGSHGLWDSHIIKAEASKRMAQVEEPAHDLKNEDKWVQEDQLTLEIIHNSLSESIFEAYSHFKTAKHLWESLQTGYGNLWESLQTVYEQDRFFSFLISLDSSYNNLINYFLRERKLPDLEDVCSLRSKPNTFKLKEFEHQVIQGRTMY